MMNHRFEVRKYRSDCFGLDYKIVDTEDGTVVDDCLTRDDADELAEAMNGLDRTFNR
jgi:hypothetical protein